MILARTMVFILICLFISCSTADKSSSKFSEAAKIPEKKNVTITTANLNISQEEKEKILKDWENEKQKFLSAEKEDWLKDVPKTLKEGMERLDKILSEGDKELFKNAKEEDVISLHFGMGMGLRNSWGLWAKSKIYHYLYARGVEDPDSMSSFILRSYIKHSQGKEFRTEIEINNQEYFEMVDAIISGENDKFLKLLTASKDLAIKKVVDNVSPVDIAIETCNSYALSTLLDLGAKIVDKKQDCQQYKEIYGGDECPESSFTLEYAAGCGNEILSILIEKEPSFIQKKEFFTKISRKSDILSKHCNLIPEKMEKKKLKELLINAAKYGSFDDIKCVAGKMKKKDVKFPMTVLAFKNMTPEKEQFILKHISSVRPKRYEILEAAGDLARFADADRLKRVFKIFDIKPDEINSERVNRFIMANEDINVLKTFFDLGLSWNTPLLFEAVHSCNPFAIDLLIEKSVDINVRENSGQLSIWELTFNGCHRNGANTSAVIKYLILRGLNVKGANAKKEIREVVSNGNLELLKFFISAGADFKEIKKNENDPSHRTLLHYSALSNNPEMIEFVLKEGDYNIDQSGYCNETPLHDASEWNSFESVKKIIELGANPNSINGKGCNYAGVESPGGKTPLMFAIESKGFAAPSLEMIKLLVDSGADISIKNNSGLTILDMAKMRLKDEEDRKIWSLKENGRSYNSGEIARLKDIISFLESKTKNDEIKPVKQ